MGGRQICESVKTIAAAPDAKDVRVGIDLGRRLGAWWVVGGAYQGLGRRIRITAQVIEVLTGALRKTVKIDGSIDHIFELQDRIGFELSRGLGLKGGPGGAGPSGPGETRWV